MTDPIIRLNATLEGRYRIERELGEGGMAKVYLAHDERHNRNVALKVLKAELAAVVGAERFLTEIETTAQLTHPHILPLHDSGEADGFLFFVAPYIEGDTLRDKIDREKQLSVEEALDITKKVASALDYAHEHGVVHRDIKPGNILLSERGEPTVADFGIALAVAHAGGGRVTETGLSVGTPHYMSPEQATGDRDVDPRTDVYALGSVLYEMLVGDPPYQGSTAQAVLAKILTDPAPAPTNVRVSIPPNVDAAIRKALEKLPADRFATAQEFAEALGDPGFRHGEEAGARVAEGSGLWKPLAVVSTMLALILSLLAGWSWWGRAPSGETRYVSRSTLSLNGDHRLFVADFLSLPLAMSPDGRQVAYVGESPAGTQLYLRPLDSFDATPLPNTDDARQPFFSPDGEWVAYFSGGNLFRVGVSGGAPLRIAPIPVRTDSEVPLNPSGGAWGPDGIVVFSAGGSLWRVTLEAGEPERVPIFLDDSEAERDSSAESGRSSRVATQGGWPSFLPPRSDDEDEDPLVLMRLESAGLAAVSVQDGRARLLGIQSGHARYAPSGHIVYTVNSGLVRAVPFDLASLEVTGIPVSVLDNVFRPNRTAGTIFAMSPTGTAVYIPGASERTLVLVDRAGRETPLPFAASDYRFPKFSPDGARLAVGLAGELMILDLATGARLPVAGGGSEIHWSPDGDEIAYSSAAGHVRSGTAPGSAVQPLFEGSMPNNVSDWGRDGRFLLLELGVPTASEGLQSGVYIASAGASEPSVVIDSPYDETTPSRSPDGRLIAYMSDVSGRYEVYVRELDADRDPVPVSVNGGKVPIWSASGDELFFWRGEQVLAARVTSSDPPQVSAPEPLFTGRYFTNGPAWDVSSSGEFVMVSAGPNWLREILLVQNFFEELRRVVPDP